MCLSSNPGRTPPYLAPLAALAAEPGRANEHCPCLHPCSRFASISCRCKIAKVNPCRCGPCRFNPCWVSCPSCCAPTLGLSAFERGWHQTSKLRRATEPDTRCNLLFLLSRAVHSRHLIKPRMVRLSAFSPCMLYLVKS